ncbi:MAG TPA: hypothetical protein VF601_23915 [Beijerinckiaceae bacterium]|jgi:carbon monoxide dehydrogenase subunit G
MATGYWKLDVDREVSSADVHSHLNGPFTVLRIDSRGGKTIIYFSGEGKDASSAATKLKAAVVKLDDATKL